MRARFGGRSIRLVAVGALAAGTLVLTGSTASAGTSASFTFSSGSLTISQPASVSFGSAPAGTTTLTGKLGAVTVVDSRGLLTDTWTVTVTSSNFTTGGGSTYETVTSSKIAYSSGSPTSTTGVGTFTPGNLASLATPGTAAVWAGTGNNTVSWDPSITVTLSPSQVAGTYAGTVTHSVA